MKNIAIFLLVGLGLFSSGYSTELDLKGLEALVTDIKDCLHTVLESDKLFTSLAEKLCNDKQSGLDNVKEAVKSTIEFLVEAECCPEQLKELNIDDLADDVLDKLNGLCLNILNEFSETLKPVLDKLCKLLDPSLILQCVHELVKMTVDKVDKTVKDVFMGHKCQPKDPKNLDLEKTKKVWDKVNCGMKEALDIKDWESLTEPVKSLVKNILDEVIKKILGNEDLDHIVKGIGCTVKSVLEVVKKVAI